MKCYSAKVRVLLRSVVPLHFTWMDDFYLIDGRIPLWSEAHKLHYALILQVSELRSSFWTDNFCCWHYK